MNPTCVIGLANVNRIVLFRHHLRYVLCVEASRNVFSCRHYGIGIGGILPHVSGIVVSGPGKIKGADTTGGSFII